MRKPKVGDRVITEGYGNIYDGHVLTITNVCGDYCYFTVNGFNGVWNPAHNFGSYRIVRYIDKFEPYIRLKRFHFAY